MKKNPAEKYSKAKRTQYSLLWFAFVCAVLYRCPRQSSSSTPSSSSIIYVKYVDGGHYFTFFEESLRRSLSPHPVIFAMEIEEPDIVVFSIFGHSHRRYKQAVKLLFWGEAWPAISTASEAFITIHCLLYTPLPRMHYFPLWASNFGDRKRSIPSDLIKSEAKVASAIAAKTGFCVFMYSHGGEGRDHLLEVVSQWDTVISLGTWKNSGLRTPSANETHSVFDIAVAEYRRFKFVIAAENRQEPGYVTEKFISAALAYAIPIYWGAKDISHHFNPKSFINAMEMTDDQLLEEIARLDEDPVAYQDMLREPWFIDNKLPAWFANDVQDGLFFGLRDKIFT